MTGEPSTCLSSFAHNSSWHGVLEEKEKSDVAEEGREFKAREQAGGPPPGMRSLGPCSLRAGRGCEGRTSMRTPVLRDASPTPTNPPHCPLKCLIMCLTTAELPPEQRGPSGRMKGTIAPSVPPAPSGGGRGGAGGAARLRVREGGGGAGGRWSAGAGRKGIPAAGADAKLAAAEYMLNYSRRRGLF